MSPSHVTLYLTVARHLAVSSYLYTSRRCLTRCVHHLAAPLPGAGAMSSDPRHRTRHAVPLAAALVISPCHSRRLTLAGMFFLFFFLFSADFLFCGPITARPHCAPSPSTTTTPHGTMTVNAAPHAVLRLRPQHHMARQPATATRSATAPDHDTRHSSP
jgi:hypothetical protein